MRRCLFLALIAAGAANANAQIAPVPPIGAPVRGAAAWRTMETEHFQFAYRVEFEAWTRDIAARMEAVRTSVRDRIGSVPDKRVVVLIDDPRSEANGNAYSWLDKPQIQLFPVPPSPRSQLGNARDWGELLIVHEFAHIAHLTRPSRGIGNLRRFALFAPAPPIVVQAPRWVKEGYATFIEGALTGSGRPSSVIRAAILRQSAADGQLPTYNAIDNAVGFNGGSFAYLMGSAYLEHLTALAGDSALPQLWRRLTARTPRSFTAAFEQTFGVRPDEAYARYTARLTANAVAIEAALDSAVRVEGTLEVQGSGPLGDPAVSPDGKKLAIGLPGGAGSPGRIVVWPTGLVPDSTRDSARTAPTAGDTARRARAQARTRDSLDLPSVPLPPRGKRVLATLRPAHGFSYRNPRFMPDNERVLVIRSERRPDGSFVPDLYEWNARTGRVRPITFDAAIRDADPFPDGERAVGTRCVAGQCDIVMIALRSGRVNVLRAGSPTLQYVRPRVSPNGLWIAASEQRGGVWRAVLIDPTNGSVKPVGSNIDANRYDFSWSRDGRALLGITEANGIPNVERIEIASGATRPLSVVFGAAMAPETAPGDSVAFYLTLTSRGYDLRRLSLRDSSASIPLPGPVRARLADMNEGAVVKQPGFTMPAFSTAPVSSPESYRLGPQRMNATPIGGATIDGAFLGFDLYGSDPNDRFSWDAAYAWSSTRRVAGGATIRSSLRLPLMTTDIELTRSRLIADWTGGALALSRSRWGRNSLTGVRLGGAYHRVERDAISIDRTHVWAAYQRTMTIASALGLDVRGQWSQTRESGDATAKMSHIVSLVTAVVRLGAGLAIRWEGSGGVITGDTLAEPFILGGIGSRMIEKSVVPQYVAVPWLSSGALSGTRFNQHVVRIDVAGAQPFAWAVRTDKGDWQRALGVDMTSELAGDGFSRTPGISATIGVAYLLDPPHRDRIRAWAGFSLRR